MKKALNQIFFTFFCCTFLLLLLFYSEECISLASNGLLIWYHNMIPSLFPFMVLSGFMIRTGLSLKIGQWLQPVLGIFFHLPSRMLYAIFMGFLCGFPMGAKIVADMLEKEQISLKEGEYLLAFCNNIGPLYMLGYVIPLFNYKDLGKVLGFMYLVPLSYGLFLRYFHPAFSFSPFPNKQPKINAFKQRLNSKLKNELTLSQCSYVDNRNSSPNYLSCFQQALSSAIEQITLLGGCMIFFNCIQIFPTLLNEYLSTTSAFPYIPLFSAIFCSLIEIGGGLKQLKASLGIIDPTSISLCLPLFLLTIGGLSCIAQTYFIIKNTELKISTYIKHKLIQSCIFIIILYFNH